MTPPLSRRLAGGHDTLDPRPWDMVREVAEFLFYQFEFDPQRHDPHTLEVPAPRQRFYTAVALAALNAARIPKAWRTAWAGAPAHDAGDEWRVVDRHGHVKFEAIAGESILEWVAFYDEQHPGGAPHRPARLCVYAGATPDTSAPPRDLTAESLRRVQDALETERDAHAALREAVRAYLAMPSLDGRMDRQAARTRLAGLAMEPPSPRSDTSPDPSVDTGDTTPTR